MRCSTCGGTRVEGCIEHAPTCPCYLPSQMFREHGDLLELEAVALRLYPDDVWPGPPRRSAA